MVATAMRRNGHTNRTAPAAVVAKSDSCGGIHDIQQQNANRLSAASDELDSLWTLIENMEARLKTLLNRHSREGDSPTAHRPGQVSANEVREGKAVEMVESSISPLSKPPFSSVRQAACVQSSSQSRSKHEGRVGSALPASECYSKRDKHRSVERCAAEVTNPGHSETGSRNALPTLPHCVGCATTSEAVLASHTWSPAQASTQPAVEEDARIGLLGARRLSKSVSVPNVRTQLDCETEVGSSPLSSAYAYTSVGSSNECQGDDSDRDKLSPQSRPASWPLTPTSPIDVDQHEGLTTSTLAPLPLSLEESHVTLKPHRKVNNYFSNLNANTDFDVDYRASSKSRAREIDLSFTMSSLGMPRSRHEALAMARRSALEATGLEKSRRTRALTLSMPTLTRDDHAESEAADFARSSSLGRLETAMSASLRRRTVRPYTMDGHREMPAIHPVPGGRHVFWTGGYDSTWRILQALLVEGRTVVPIYMSGVIDNYSSLQHNRRSKKFELTAMQAIRDEITQSFPSAGARLKDLVVVPEVSMNKEVTKHMSTLKSKNMVRRRRCQIGAMAQLSCNMATSVDVGVVKDEFLHQALGDYLEHKDGENSISPEAIKEMPELGIFKWLRFPLLSQTKEDILEEATQRGYEHIMEMTWTCWFPRNGEQCGKCAMCKHRIL